MLYTKEYCETCLWFWMAPVKAPRSENDNHVRTKGSKGCLGYFMLFSEKKPHRNTASNSEQSGNIQLETDTSRVEPLSTLILNYCQSVRALCKYWRAQAEHTQLSGGRHVIPAIITGWKKILSDLECLSKNTLKSMSGWRVQVYPTGLFVVFFSFPSLQGS